MTQRLDRPRRPAPPAPRTGLRLLTVAGPTGARAAADLTAALVLASTVVSPLLDGVAVAVFALVLGTITLVRVLAVPAALQGGLGAALLVAAWAAALRWYEQVWWLDLVVHLGLTGLLAAVAGILLHRSRMIPAGTDRPGRWGIALTTTTVGTSLGVAWEIAEWFGHTFVDDSIHIPPADTMGDLAAGALGAAIAGLLLAHHLGRRG